ncbi:hypothetical protein [Streptomyces sp. NPDC088736]|uniref:hypothetical protein n=1 Tax=Streptomyces sp. NPDC088736 TaxID=3365881 RepID=UPI00382D326A
MTITFPTGPAAPAAGPRPTAPVPVPASVSVRALLGVVLEALAVPNDTYDHDRRVLERARIARILADEALSSDTDSDGFAWNLAYLRTRLAAEQAAANARAALVCDNCHQPFRPAGSPTDYGVRFEDTPWCRWCAERCRTSTTPHDCHVCRTAPEPAGPATPADGEQTP